MANHYAIRSQIPPPDRSNAVISDSLSLHETASKILNYLLLSGSLKLVQKDDINDSKNRERLQEIFFN